MKESADLSLKLNAIIMCFLTICSRRDRETAKWLMINTKHPLYGSHPRKSSMCTLYNANIITMNRSFNYDLQ